MDPVVEARKAALTRTLRRYSVGKAESQKRIRLTDDQIEDINRRIHELATALIVNSKLRSAAALVGS